MCVCGFFFKLLVPIRMVSRKYLTLMADFSYILCEWYRHKFFCCVNRLE